MRQLQMLKGCRATLAKGVIIAAAVRVGLGAERQFKARNRDKNHAPGCAGKLVEPAQCGGGGRGTGIVHHQQPRPLGLPIVAGAAA